MDDGTVASFGQDRLSDPNQSVSKVHQTCHRGIQFDPASRLGSSLLVATSRRPSNACICKYLWRQFIGVWYVRGRDIFCAAAGTLWRWPSPARANRGRPWSTSTRCRSFVHHRRSLPKHNSSSTSSASLGPTTDPSCYLQHTLTTRRLLLARPDDCSRLLFASVAGLLVSLSPRLSL